MNVIGGKEGRIDDFSADFLPGSISGIDGVFSGSNAAAAKNRVEPIKIGLDVFRPGFVAAGAVPHAQRVASAKQVIGPPRRVVALLNRPHALHVIVERGGNQTRTRRDAGDQFRLVHRQFVFAPGKETQAGVQPIGEVAGDQFDAFAKLVFGKQTPGASAARARTAGDHGIDPQVHRCADK